MSSSKTYTGLPVLMDLCLFGTLPLLMGNRQGENLLIDLFRHCDNHLGEKQVNNPFFHKTPSGSARQPLQLTNDVTKMMQKHQLETPQFHQTRFSVLQNVPRSTEKCHFHP
ncbi:40S ribosomal protein S4-3 [Zea mays]|uniref:40S ribosomal protein S4-3 n=1 Tax=Zea mays TaxID=4577 RepID=A0A1D6NZM1_MAIZE|nr:40S ribosomal protein S4-3 [Zea mays]